MKKILSTWCLVLIAFAPAALGKTVKRHLGVGIEGKYIVLFPLETPGAAVDGLADSLAATYNLQVTTTWEYVKGFVATGSLQAATALAADPRVEMVEQDVLMRAPVSGVGTTINPTYLNGQPLWYLDRLDEDYWNATTPPDNSYHRCRDGAATVAYVVDMPVWAEHSSIARRVSTTRIDCSSGTCVESDAAAACKNNNQAIFAGLSHGTAVASLISGHANGAALAEIIPVTIFPCQSSPTTSVAIVLAAMNWIEGNVYVRRNAVVPDNRPSAVNHSGYLFPWDADSPTYTAKARDFVINTNVPYFTSADNFGSDSCLFSPNANAYTRTSRHWSRGIFVVGGTARNYGGADETWLNPNWTENPDWVSQDAQYRGTNLGGCVSAFAPADQIYAAAHSPNPKDSNPTLDENLYGMNQDKSSGTSWAAPLAAGVALRRMEELGTQPYYTSLYDWLIGWNASPAKATVNATELSAYKICYVPGSPTLWNYVPAQMSCGPAEAQYDMPRVGNTSDARMLTWERGCP